MRYKFTIKLLLESAHNVSDRAAVIARSSLSCLVFCCVRNMFILFYKQKINDRLVDSLT